MNKKMTLQRLKCVCVCVGFAALTACKKEPIAESAVSTVAPTVTEGRLQFANEQSFQNLMNNLHDAETPEEIERQVNSVVGNLSASSPKSSFISHFKSLQSEQPPVRGLGVLSLKTLSQDSVSIIDTLKQHLVPDSRLASVLNAQLEVGISQYVYKVSPWGTFRVESLHYQDLLDLLEKNAFPTDTTVDVSQHQFYKQSISEDRYAIATGIELCDTYKNATKQEKETENVHYYPLNDFTKKTMSIYDGIPTAYYGGKTWAGRTLEKIFGRNEEYSSYWGGDRRVKVSFYNRNWWIYASVGCALTMEKKNRFWFATWWSNTTAQELRLGWDVLSFVNKFSTPGLVPAITYGQKVNVFGYQPATLVNAFGYGITSDDVFRAGVPEAINILKRYVPIDKTVPKVFVMWNNWTRSMLTSIVSAAEQVAYNTSQIDKCFASSWGFTIGANLNTLNINSFAGSAMTFEIDAASIYGLAKYDNQWKGARIIKEKSN